jgi:hypothetical protein
MRPPLEAPTFRQTVVIVQDVVRHHPTASWTDRLELIKTRHVTLGFQYANDQIHRAVSAVQRPRAGLPLPRSSNRLGRSTSRRV